LTKTGLGIAIVVYEVDTRGGMERQALRLARGLAERGARVTVVTTFSPPGLGLPLPLRLRERRDGYEILRVPCLRWWSGEAVRALFDLVLSRVLLSKRRRIEVVYAVQFRAGAHAGRVARVRGLPTVVKLACGGTYGDMAQLAASPELEAPLRAVERYACLSQQVRREVESRGFDPERCTFVRNGVDVTAFSPTGERADLGPGRWVIFVGRHDSQKRIDVLLRSFAAIAARLPDVRLACVGKGPEEARLRELARSLALEERVRFLGERRDVPELLRAASVFVLPSAAEGLPNVLLEALAVGLPAVVTDIPGTDEVVQHEREALMVPVDDVAALAAAIERVLTTPELAERLARAGHALVLREFDMERVVDKHVEIFESMKRPGRVDPRLPLVLALAFARALLLGWFYALGRRVRPSGV
jgi:glycosyltransferase involved in cell wall biosynthesis